MAARIEVICVCQCLAFASLFATVPGEYMLVVIVVEVLVLVNVVVRHSSSENFRKVRLEKNNSRRHRREKILSLVCLVETGLNEAPRGSLYRLSKTRSARAERSGASSISNA